MNLIFFSTCGSACSQDRICRSISHALPDITIKHYTELAVLIEWLQVPPRDFFAAVLVPKDCEIMNGLIKIKPYFADRKTILIVPKNHPEILSMGQKIGFSYIQGEKDDFRTVVSLLKSWLEDEKKAKKWMQDDIIHIKTPEEI